MEIQGSIPAALRAALNKLSTLDDVEARGAIYTRLEVVELILDLSGYTENKKLYKKRLLEPSFGGGDFLLLAVSRLLASWKADKRATSALDDLGNAIRAVELHHKTFESTRNSVISMLKQAGINASTAIALADRWLIKGDFLLIPLEGQFDFVVGNPPYVRQELIPTPLLVEYRSRYQTMYDRADLYIPFIERSLSTLSNGGHLGFICADRWVKNRYGGPLRNLISKQFHLKIYIDMSNTQAFHSEVVAYPAITIICRETPGSTRIAHQPTIDASSMAYLAKELLEPSLPKIPGNVRELARVINGSDPWRHFFFQGAGQKPQLFVDRNRRAREDEAIIDTL
jgi:hypothetical protein